MASDYRHIHKEHQADYGRKLTAWAQDHLANRYSDRTHFIFELLQNAEDALTERGDSHLPTSVSFTLLHDGLEVRHFGKSFAPENVKSICAINESTKKDDLTEIGCFGIGFKSVYAFTKRPEVHSGDEHFAIEGFVLPVEVPSRPISEGETLFWIPFSPGDSTAAAEIASALSNLGPRRLLFLKAVTEISWSTPDGTKGLFLKNPPKSDQIRQRIHLLGEIKGDNDPISEQWLLFSRPVHKADGRWAGNVEIAFQLSASSSHCESIQSTSDSKLVVFFPTEVATGLGFLIQGPYRTTPSRDVVPPNDPWNRMLVNETADLLVSSLHSLKAGGLLGVDALCTLPIEARTYPAGGMLRPLFEKVAAALKQEELVPVYGGGHRAGKSCRLARGEGLRELFDPRQLAALLGEQGEVHWITEEITQNKAPTLRGFLMQHVGVVEITPDFLVPRLTENFLKQQSDEWMCLFYAFLSGQKAVLGELRKRGTPIIRRQDDTHVSPFRGALPQAFLPGSGTTGFSTVKDSICAVAESLEFLRSLGLSEPDPVDDVIQNVLCHYRDDSVSRAGADYESDIARIRAAFATDSDQARRKLIDGLKAVYFVRSVNAHTGEVRFRKPEHVYRATQRLREVFSGIKGVWLVDDSLAGLKGETARDLLTACGTLDVIRVVPTEGSLTWEQREKLRVQRGANTKTWDRIDGDGACSEIEDLLAVFPSLTPDDAKNRAAAFWMLLRDTLRDRRDAYFQARYVWGYAQRDWHIAFPATWVRAIREAKWIPNAEGKLHAPSEICFSEVAEEIRNNESPFLTEILGFRPEAIKELAEKEGIDLETLNLLKRHKVSAEQLRRLLGDSGNNEDEQEGEASSGESERESNGGEDGQDEGEDETDSNGDRGAEESGGGHGHGGSGESGSGGGSGRGGSGKERKGGTQAKQFHSYVAVNTNSDPTDDEGLSADERRAIESAAIDYILSEESQLKRTPTNNPGFDLYEGESLEFVARFVEVKSKKAAWSGAVALSEEQFRLAEIERERFWLYVVEHAQDPSQRRLHKIQDPAGKSKYFTFDSGWKLVAAEGSVNTDRRNLA